jgi:hypothetical protein
MWKVRILPIRSAVKSCKSLKSLLHDDDDDDDDGSDDDDDDIAM